MSSLIVLEYSRDKESARFAFFGVHCRGFLLQTLGVGKGKERIGSAEFLKARSIVYYGWL